MCSTARKAPEIQKAESANKIGSAYGGKVRCDGSAYGGKDSGR